MLSMLNPKRDQFIQVTVTDGSKESLIIKTGGNTTYGSMINYQKTLTNVKIMLWGEENYVFC